jgi:hypothetical protein
MHIDAEMLGVLKLWKQLTPFSSLEDWMFGSTVQIGRLPISYTGCGKHFEKQRPRQASGTSVRTCSGTVTAPGWTPLELL